MITAFLLTIGSLSLTESPVTNQTTRGVVQNTQKKSKIEVIKPVEEKLWSGKAPASVGSVEKNTPTITIYAVPKEKANGTAVVVCPGGGYGALAWDHEGKQIAEWLNNRGASAFILKYRIVSKDRPSPLAPAPMLDVQRAIRTVRAHAKEYGIDPNKIGVWGFSAGGHLASTAATHFDRGMKDSMDPIDQVSCRPDFAILAYPVIMMNGKYAHRGSANNLIGNKADQKNQDFYSSHLQVTKDTPPTFLFSTVDDRAVPVENSREFKAACEKNGVPVELVEYPNGPHGVGLAKNKNLPKGLSEWPNKLEGWLIKMNFLPKSK